MASTRTQINTEYSDVKFKSFFSSTYIMTSSSQNRHYIPLHKGEKSVHVQGRFTQVESLYIIMNNYFFTLNYFKFYFLISGLKKEIFKVFFHIIWYITPGSTKFKLILNILDSSIYIQCRLQINLEKKRVFPINLISNSNWIYNTKEYLLKDV